MLYIIIPVHNRKKFTKQCLFSLRQQTYKDFKIVVVDDGSTDGTWEMLENEFPEVHVIQGDGNLWWTGSINVGLKYVLKNCDYGDLVLLLNDDLIVEKDYLYKIIRFHKKNPNTIIGSVEVLTDNAEIIKSGGVIIKPWKGKMHILNSGRKITEFSDEHYEYVDTLTGRGTLYPIKVFEELGLFDVKHFPHYGDYELPIRAKKNGYILSVYYNAIVKSFPENANSKSLQKKDVYSIHDFKKYFFDKYSNFNLFSRWYLSRIITSNLLMAFYFYTINISRNFKRFIVHLKLKKNN